MRDIITKLKKERTRYYMTPRTQGLLCTSDLKKSKTTKEPMSNDPLYQTHLPPNVPT